MEEVVIVGAGVAGLSCMNAFLDQGIQPLLVEAKTIGQPKLCGEFISFQTMCQLEQWGIGPIQKIDTIELIGKRNAILFQQPSGAISRSEVELQLAQRARRLGGQVEEQSPLTNVAPYSLVRANGEVIRTKKLVIATGRLFAAHCFPYIGLKAHFAHDTYQPQLTMHLFGDGYYGTVPISETVSNIACLVKKRALKKAIALLPQSLEWLQAPVPEFGVKQTPSWPDTYFIGDSLASLPPAVGGGFNLAIQSSLLAVDNDPDVYRAQIVHTLSKQMAFAKFVHRTMLSNTMSQLAIAFFKFYPQLLERLLHHIGLSPTLTK